LKSILPIDRIMVRLPAQPRLASVVKTAVLWEARQCGLTPAEARPLARAVAQSFRSFAGKRGASPHACVNISLELSPGQLLVRIAEGAGARVVTLRGRTAAAKRDVPFGRPAAGKMGRKHPSV
jgi:hypothetical protein